MPYKPGFLSGSGLPVTLRTTKVYQNLENNSERGTIANPLSTFGAVADDIVVLFMITRYTAATVSEATTPSGWNKVLWANLGAAPNIFHLYWKKMTSGDTSSISFDSAPSFTGSVDKFYTAFVFKDSTRAPSVIGTPSSEGLTSNPSNQSVLMGLATQPAIAFGAYATLGPNGNGSLISDGEARLRIGGVNAADGGLNQNGNSSVTNMRFKYKVFNESDTLETVSVSLDNPGFNFLGSFGLQV